MRILYAVSGYKPAFRIGGPIHSVSAVTERLVRRGHQVIVFTSNANLDEDLDVPTDRPVDVDGVQVWYFKREEPFKKWCPFLPYLAKASGFLYAPAMKSQLIRIISGVDLVHTHMPFVYPTYAAGRAAIQNHKPLFYHQRGVLDPRRLKFRSVKKRVFVDLVERPILKGATTLIALTEAEVESYRALGIETPCRVIPNGIEGGDYRAVSGCLAEKSLGIAEDALVVLFLGRLHPIKGADKLLEAFLRIHSKRPSSVLVMAGPDEWGMVQRFRDGIGKVGIGERVKFPGMVTGEMKKSLLSRADVMCLPSEAEGFSMAVLEALASSTAVLLSPGCHFPDVETARAGKVVGDTSECVADALLEMLSNREELRRMGSNGRRLVEEHYGWDRIVDLTVDAYEEGIERVRSSPRG